MHNQELRDFLTRFHRVESKGLGRRRGQGTVRNARDLDRIIITGCQTRRDRPLKGSFKWSVRRDGPDERTALEEVNSDAFGQVIIPLNEVRQSASPDFATVGDSHLNKRSSCLE